MLEEPLPSLSVLVVEDQTDVAESTAELLTLCGCDVRIAGSGVAALVAAADRTPDVVLLDIGLPEMNGWEVARQMRAQAKGKQPLMVAVTGFGSDGDRWRSADSGIDMHLVKPASPATLTDLLSRVRRILATNQ